MKIIEERTNNRSINIRSIEGTFSLMWGPNEGSVPGILTHRVLARSNRSRSRDRLHGKPVRIDQTCPTFFCCAGNFGKIWSVRGQHEIQYIKCGMFKYTYNKI
jgi:hypothetical protein